MHEHRTHAPKGEPSRDAVAKAVLGLLVDDQPGPQTPEELTRKVTGFTGDPRQARIQVLDALTDLAEHGLIHRLDGFVFASQAGHRAHALGDE